jgi:hypothetical protein
MAAEFGYEDISGVIQPIGWRFVLDLSSGYDQEGENAEISISNTNVFSALQDLYDKFKVPFFMSNNTVIVGGEKKYVEHRFRYGKGNGLYKITKTKLNDDIITKVKGVGSERNIPYGYLQEQKKSAGLAESPMSRLMPFIFRETLLSAAAFPSEASGIRDYYVSDNHNEKFPRTSFQTLEDIYPTIRFAQHDVVGARADKRIDKIVGVYFDSSSVAYENSTIVKDDKEEIVNPRFWIKVPPLGFDLKNCLNEKDKLVLSPTTGYCGGCKFNVLSIGSKQNRWEGYRVDTLYEYDKLTVPAVNQGVYYPADREITYDSNKLELPALASISYNFIGSMTVKSSTTALAGAVIAIHLYKNGVYFHTLHTQELEPETDNVFIDSISETGAYQISAGSDIAEYQIIATITTYSESSQTSALVEMNKTECLVTYPVSPEDFSDTTDESQWLLVQKDKDS